MKELDETTAVERSEDLSESAVESINTKNRVAHFLRENRGKTAVILAMGAASGLANAEHGLEAILTAGLKQCAYSGTSAVVLLSIYNKLAERVKTLPGELVPIVAPTLLTIAANYGVHSLRGTAEPLLSTLPTAITVIIGFPIWHIRTRILELWKDIENINISLS